MTLRSVALATVAAALAVTLAACTVFRPTPEPAEASAQLTAIADEALARLLERNAYARTLRGLPVSAIEDITLDAAREEADFSRALLARLERLPTGDLPQNQWLLAGMLRDTLERGTETEKNYWHEFAVTPYKAGLRMSQTHQVLSAQTLQTADDRARYLRLLDEYADLIAQMAAKTLAQAERGIRVPQAALPGARQTFAGLRAAAPKVLAAGDSRLAGVADSERTAYQADVARRIEQSIVPTYDRVLGILDAAYEKAAPVGVGLGQYQGGREAYLRLVKAETALDLSPEQIHELGTRNAEQLEREMAAIRKQLGFKGSRAEFHAKLRKDPRFLAKKPEDVERRYMKYVRRIEPLIPKYFATVPRAGYGVKRLEASGEAGMTFGYYQRPSPSEPKGLYRYNGSDLANRSLITAQHLIYHELIPGHHFHIALQNEMRDAHPIREFLLYPGFNEGWAEYAASLAEEMGLLDDPYDRYGHLLMQAFLNTRLVVDTGMNHLGWSLEQARAYMRDHTFQSDAEIATESLRYSTDLPAQALVYRLGYEKIWELRRRAETALGAKFDIRDFHAAVVGGGALPLNVLEAHIDRFIAQRQGASASPGGGDNFAAVRAAIAKQHDASVKRLQDWIRLPTIAAEKLNIDEGVARMMELAREAGFQSVKEIETGGIPAVFATLDAGAARTVGLYFMYDVKQYDPAEWKLAAPLSAAIVDKPGFGKVMVGRGAVNQKGPQAAFLAALHAIKAAGQKPPVNLVLIAEGEEEIGSPNFRKAIANPEVLTALKRTTGVFMPLSAQDPDGAVTVWLGAKGVVELELVASGEKWGRGPKQDVHSSNRARLDSPAFHLVQALNTLVTKDGDPAIDGFGKEARPPSAAQKAMLDQAATRLSEAVAKRQLGVERWAHDLSWRASWERFLFAPTVNIEGLVAGYTGPGGKTVLPHRAVAKLDLRLVPDMTFDGAIAKLKAHLARRGFGDIEVNVSGGYDPTQTAHDAPLIRAQLAVYRRAGFDPVVIPRGAGSYPGYVFTGAPVSLAAGHFGLGHGGAAHAPDEYFVIEPSNPKVAGWDDVVFSYVQYLHELARVQ